MIVITNVSLLCVEKGTLTLSSPRHFQISYYFLQQLSVQCYHAPSDSSHPYFWAVHPPDGQWYKGPATVQTSVSIEQELKNLTKNWRQRPTASSSPSPPLIPSILSLFLSLHPLFLCPSAQLLIVSVLLIHPLALLTHPHSLLLTSTMLLSSWSVIQTAICRILSLSTSRPDISRSTQTIFSFDPETFTVSEPIRATYRV